jgi:hypothetical protein
LFFHGVVISKDPLVFRSAIESEFAIKYLGQAEFLLGMNLARTSDHLHIHQTKYVERKLIEYGLESAPPASCPLNPKEYLKAATTHQIFELQQLGVSYRGIVGSLNYLSVLTRPDISYAVSVLSQHLEHPGIQHYRAAQQVFCYLSGTKQVGLLFTKTSPLSLSAQVDADWGNCPDTRRLVTGYLVLTANQLLSWKSTRQPTVSLSSTEAEYKALSDLGREIAWFASLTSELHLNCQPREVPIGVDNQGAIDLAEREVSQNSFRTKHMDIRLHFVREQVASHLLKLHYIRTTENSAHFLTKPTGRCTIRRSLQAIGVTTLPSDPAPTLAAQSTPGCWDSAKVSKKNKQETRQITHNSTSST